MKPIKWARRFGVKTSFEMSVEQVGVRMAARLLKMAYRLDPQLQHEHRQNESGRRIAYDLVYGRIDATRAKSKFYATYY